MLHKNRTCGWVIAFLLVTTGCQEKSNNGSGKTAKQSPFFPSEITLKEHVNDGQLMELQDERLVFKDQQGDEWVAPKGTLTDGASIPRLALTITDDRHRREFLKAAVLHDAYCGIANKNVPGSPWRTRPPEKAHRMFLEAMIDGKTEHVLAHTMYAAVLIAGEEQNCPLEEVREISDESLLREFTSTRTWIAKIRPSPDEIETRIKRRGPTVKKLDMLERRVSAALVSSAIPDAERLLREEEDLIDQELERFPGDSMLLNFKGSMHKNRAVVYRKKQDVIGFRAQLAKAKITFKSIIVNDPEDPAALSGLGGASMLLNDLESAEHLTRRALDIAPRLNGARLDLDEIVKRRSSD